jgi:hypothetical protein
VKTDTGYRILDAGNKMPDHAYFLSGILKIKFFKVFL